MLIIIFSIFSILLSSDEYQKFIDLMESKNYPSRTAFNLCKKTKWDCTYFKAKVFESDGNAGSAMDLYLRSGYYDDYIRLRTYSGADIEPIIKQYKIDEKKAYFYRGLSEYTKGNWQKAINIFLKDILKDYLQAKLYMAYSYLMLGENDKAEEIQKNRVSNLSFYDWLEYKKLEGLILYAKNDQFKAKKIFINVLVKKPGD
ncbi:MAG: hypothetical protein NTY22_08965, partial [Proteobacteria bacterium]|nr:hypothetical protein [Pseudomonadota bacterium]